MPYKKITPVKPVMDISLVSDIARELRLQQSEGTSDAPLIIEEEALYTDRIHVTVIWDRWAHIDPEDRSRIIMDAYERERGAKSVLTLSAALGLTHAEAKKLGVENGVLSAAA